MGPLTQEDPIGLAGGLNLYGFANGDPVNFDDPFGLCPWCLAAAAGAAIDGGLRVASNALAGRDLSDGVLQAAAVGAVAGAAGFRIGRLIGRGLAAARGATATVGELTATHGVTRSRRKMAALVDDIAENGIQEPIKFVEHNGTKYVVDGHHRLRAARQLGIDEVPVEQVSLPFRGYETTDDLVEHIPRGRF